MFRDLSTAVGMKSISHRTMAIQQAKELDLDNYDYDDEQQEIADEEGSTSISRMSMPVVKVDFAAAYEADISMEPAREIQIRWARQLCFELRNRGFNIRLLTFDQFQSKDGEQILNAGDSGVQSYRVSTDLSTEPWYTLRDLFYGSRIQIPENELLLRELLALTKKFNGKVDHPPSLSKDLADALAGSVVGALRLGGQESPDGARAYYSPPEFITSFIPARELPLGFSLEAMDFGYVSDPLQDARGYADPMDFMWGT